MKIILRQNVPSLGKIGQIVDVSDAQARNYLIPKKLAEAATASVISAHEHQVAREKSSQTKRRQALDALVEQLAGTTIELTGKASPQGKLFAALKSGNIQLALEKKFSTKLDGIRTKPDHLKSLGAQQVEIFIDEHHTATITVDVHG